EGESAFGWLAGDAVAHERAAAGVAADRDGAHGITYRESRRVPVLREQIGGSSSRRAQRAVGVGARLGGFGLVHRHFGFWILDLCLEARVRVPVVLSRR